MLPACLLTHAAASLITGLQVRAGILLHLSSTSRSSWKHEIVLVVSLASSAFLGHSYPPRKTDFSRFLLENEKLLASSSSMHSPVVLHLFRKRGKAFSLYSFAPCSQRSVTGVKEREFQVTGDMNFLEEKVSRVSVTANQSETLSSLLNAARPRPSSSVDGGC